ncbi:hypothetical protein GCM10027569_30230 [Flindersiella endophytica]
MLRNRSSILDAARRHLVEIGYHRLSLESVAADAGVTRMTIYRQFGSKLGLLDAIAEDLATRSGVVAAVERAAALSPPTTAFRALISELCRFWSTDPEVFRRLLSLAAVDSEASSVVEARESWRREQIALFVEPVAAEGRLPEPSDANHATAVVAALTSFPTCDELATRLGCALDALDSVLLTLLTPVVRLD